MGQLLVSINGTIKLYRTSTLWRKLMKQKLTHYAFALLLSTSGCMAYAASPAQLHAMTQGLKVNLEQAIQHAVQAVPGTVLEIELDDGDGQGVRYEADVLTPSGESVEVWVDGVSGQAHVHERNSNAKRKDKERAQAAKIDMRQAVQAAIAHTPGKAVKAELDNHWGTVSYQVDVMQPDSSIQELKIDASNAQVLRAKKD